MTDIEHAKAVKAKYEPKFMSMDNIVAMSVGLKQRGGVYTEEIAIVFHVREKRPANTLSADEVLPDEIEGVPVDVQESGEINALDA